MVVLDVSKKYDVKKYEKKISKIKAAWFLIFLFSSFTTKHIFISNKTNLEKLTGNSFEELLNLVM